MHVNAYMWNLEKWYRRTYFQDRNRDTDVETRHVDIVGKGESRMNWEVRIDTYTLPGVK